MNQQERRKYLIQELLDEREEYCHIEIPQNESSQKLLLRDLMNVREPKKIKSEFYRIQDAYLQTAIEEKGIVDAVSYTHLYHGELVGFDCHEELLKNCTVYKEIYESQNSKDGDYNG